MSEEERITIEVYPNGLRHVFYREDESCGLSDLEVIERIAQLLDEIKQEHSK